MSSPSSSDAAPRIGGLRANALAAVVMLLIQYSLGVSVNLYSTPPAGDAGKSLFAGFTSAVGDGPLLLSLHALLGTLLLITASAALARSLRLGATPPIALTGVALLVIVAAWLAGSEFVGHMKNGASLAMALATAVAILCYALVIFLVDSSPRSPVS
jgi:quinol-cytochrome oxidoreductase complex cytochrome b subunit